MTIFSRGSEPSRLAGHGAGSRGYRDVVWEKVPGSGSPVCGRPSGLIRDGSGARRPRTVVWQKVQSFWQTTALGRLGMFTS